MSTASEHERRHDRLAIAEAYAAYLMYPPNGLENDLFGDTSTRVNAPLALIQCGLKWQVELLEKLSRDGLLLAPQAPAQNKTALPPHTVRVDWATREVQEAPAQTEEKP